MPECTVCGERDFEEHDGHYFCATCNTQSQDVRVILAEEENFDSFHRSGLIKEVATPRQSKKQEGDQGRPWSVYEAYQIIIQHQVDALIKLGAQERLREVVFQIWMNYLSRLQVAFTKETVTKVKYDRQRELFPSTTDQPKIKNVLGRRSRRRTLGLSARKVQKKVERDQTIEALQNEEFYREDNPLNDSGSTETSSRADDWSSSEDDEDEIKWGHYRKNRNHRVVETVKMISTISVCFLGLMYTNPLITASDLTRWICKKKIPFIDVRAMLPEDMKFCLHDWKLFGFGSSPTSEQIRDTSGKIAWYIGLDDFPKFPLEGLINKYIIQLDLPAELHAYTNNLSKSMNLQLSYIPGDRHKTAMFWEGIAMAYIVILLKLMFGLDDSNEILLSEYTKELNDVSECAQPLFVWTDWVQHMKNKMQIQDQQKSKNIERRYDCGAKVTERLNATQYLFKFTETVKEPLCQPFVELSKRWKSKNSGDPQTLLSVDNSLHGNPHNDILIDFNINTLDEEDPLDILQHDSADENDSTTWESQRVGKDQENKIDKEIQSKSDSFRKSSVQHILSPGTYLSDLQNRIDTRHLQEKTEGNDSETILSQMIADDFYERSASSAKRRRVDDGGSKQQQKNICQLDDEECNIHDKMEKYKAVIEKLQGLRCNFEAEVDFDTGNRSLSSDWLMKICCHWIQCDTEELQNMILKLEIMSFVETGDLSMYYKGNMHFNRLRSSAFFAKKLKLFQK